MPAPRRVSDVQLEELIAWMEDHPLQARATQLGGSQAKQSSTNLWEDLASRLNAVGDGITKTPKEWRQYWTALKCKLRKKGALLIQHGRGTGGGPAASDILSPIEARIISLIGENTIIGNENVRVEVDMGLDESVVATPPLPSVDSEGSGDHPTRAVTPPAGPSTPRPPKRKHVAKSSEDNIDSPAEKSRHLTGPPRWALELEQRRLAVEELRLEEERAYRRSMLEEQRTFHRELLSLLGRLVESMTTPPPL